MDFFDLIGLIILVLIAAWVFNSIRRTILLIKSLGASKGNETAMELEKLRLKAFLIRLVAIILGPAAFALLLMADAPVQVAVIAGVVVYGCLSLFARNIKNQYDSGFKEKFVAAELGKVFTNLDYKPDGVFDGDKLRELGFFKNFDRVRGSDFISATYKGINFLQSDLSLQTRWTSTERDSSGRTRTVEHWDSFFSGRVMQFEFAAPFRGSVQVVKRNFDQALVASLRGTWQSVETELAEFNEDYEVFAQDSLDAMAVLTPQMIEGIYALDKKLRVPAAFYFNGNFMYAFMALGRDAFDTSGKKTLLQEREFLQEDISLITDFLENMYFKKQEGTEPKAEEATERQKNARSEHALPNATPDIRDSLQRMGYKVAYAGGVLSRIILYTPLVFYILSAVYMLVEFPDGFALSYSSYGDDVSIGERVPTLGYLLIGSFFIVPSALGVGIALATIITSISRAINNGFGLGAAIKGMFASIMGMVMFTLPLAIHLFFLSVNIAYS